MNLNSEIDTVSTVWQLSYRGAGSCCTYQGDQTSGASCSWQHRSIMPWEADRIPSLHLEHDSVNVPWLHSLMEKSHICSTIICIDCVLWCYSVWHKSVVSDVYAFEFSVRCPVMVAPDMLESDTFLFNSLLVEGSLSARLTRGLWAGEPLLALTDIDFAFLYASLFG